MMMNRIGKGLVLAHTAISLLALSWAAGLYVQFTDWGWKEPRTNLGYRVPSEYDKRAASFKEAVKARDMVMPVLQPAQASLLKAETSLANNHLYYNEALARLSGATEPIAVKAIKKEGATALDTPIIGKPVLEDKAIEGITKSYQSYLADLKNIGESIKSEIGDINKWTEAAQKVTFELNGKDATGKKVPNFLGIYDLLDLEKKAQDQALAEKDYLEPVWTRSLQESQGYRERREQLEEYLDRLRQSKK